MIARHTKQTGMIPGTHCASRRELQPMHLQHAVRIPPGGSCGLYIHSQVLFIDMFTGMCIDMFTDMCTDMCIDMRTDKCIDLSARAVRGCVQICVHALCVDKCIDMCTGYRR